MRWLVIGVICGLGVAALSLILVLLPLKVSVHFARTRGRNLIRVRAGFLWGLVWIPVYTRSSRPKRGNGDGDEVAARDGVSRLVEWVSRVKTLWSSLGEPGDGESPQREGRRTRTVVWWRRAQASSGNGGSRGALGALHLRQVPRRVAHFLFRAIRAEGLDVQELRVRLELGSGEAATSAIGVGLAHALINTALAAFPVPLRFPCGKPDINVVPRYDRAAFDASIHCILALTPGYIILRGIQTTRRRRRPSCRTTR